MDLSIVVPAYNEEARLAGTIKSLQAFLKSLGINYEVIIVVEQSSDQTAKIALAQTKNNPLFRVIANSSHRGKGHAVRTGMLEARGKIIFFMDADLSTDLSCVTSFIEYFNKHPEADILIGSREHRLSVLNVSQNPMRRSMGRTFNLFVRLLVLKGVRDTQCGFKAFRKPVARRLFKLQKSEGFSFDVEILALAKLFHYKTEVLPVRWSDARNSKVHILSGSFHMLAELLTIRRRLKSVEKP